MSGLSPRKSEVEAVVEILERTVQCPECGGFGVGDWDPGATCPACNDLGSVSAWDEPEDLARALLREIFKLIQQREQLYLVGVPNGYGQLVAYGPFAAIGDAERAARDSALEGGVVRPMYGEQLLLFDDEVKHVDPVCTCGHPRATHQHEKGRGWCWAKGGSTKGGNTCGCKQYEAAA